MRHDIYMKNCTPNYGHAKEEKSADINISDVKENLVRTLGVGPWGRDGGCIGIGIWDFKILSQNLIYVNSFLLDI